MLAFISLLLSPVVFALPPARIQRQLCGSHPSVQHMSDAELKFSSKISPITAGATGPIQVHWHAISGGTTYENGNIDQKAIDDSITVLNDGFEGTGVSFTLANVTRTRSYRWFSGVAPGNNAQNEMKSALRVGNEATLNVYSVGFTSEEAAGLLGYATFPSDYDENPIDDGVVVRQTTLPGGTEAPFNLGITLVHEVGHWVGLYHTFEGGCSGPGDYVADTPKSKSATSGCPKSRDSCTADPGQDPVSNYMDYSDDACLSVFTPGQTKRLKTQLRSFRNLSL